MKRKYKMLITFTLLITTFSFSTAAGHNSDHLAQWAAEQSKWLSRTGPATTLKLFETLGYNATKPHLIFSPLSLKLSLLSVAALSNEDQEKAVARFLFNQPVHKSMLRMNFEKSEAPEKKVTVKSNGSTPCLYGIEKDHLRRSYRQVDTTAPAYCDQLSYFLSRLCSAYTRSTSPVVSSSELTRPQKIALCHFFSIADFSECVQSFIGDPSDFCTDSVHQYIEQYNSNYSNADIAWQEVRQFHRSEDKFGGFFHRVLLLGDEVQQQSKLWKRTLEWFQMRSYVLPRDGETWEGFKRDHLPNELYELDLQPVTPSFLNFIHFDLKLNRTFIQYRHQANFFTSTGDVVQVDTFMSDPAHFPIVLHESGEKFHTLIRVPYEDLKYSLILMLPDQSSNVGEMLKSLTPKKLDYYFKRLLIDEPINQKVVLTLPKFNLTSHLDFGPYMATQNLSTFNLTRVSPSLTVPSSIHQYIQLSNLGVKSGPEKLVLEARSDDQPSDVSINDFLPINRPFAYLILGSYVDLHHKPASEILLAGYYNKPV